MKAIICSLSLCLYTCLCLGQIASTPEEVSPLLIGEKIPEVFVNTVSGDKKLVTEILKEKPSVLLFYRGGWCPFCNTHLAEVGEVETEITALGYQIIAVSPDSPENLQVSLEEQKLNYQLYSDAGGELIKTMGLAFRAPEKYDNMLSKFSAGKNEGILPVPALFVTDTNGVILFEYVSPDYRQRISSEMLMAVLKNLQN